MGKHYHEAEIRVRRAPFVGRNREEELLRARLTAALEGQGGLVLIAGEAGIGKTALAERLCETAIARGARVGVGRAADVAEVPPFGVWQEAINALPLATVTPPVPPAFAPAGTGAALLGPTAVYAQVREMLAALAIRQPLVLLIEDLHWADTASLDLLRFLAPTLPALPLLVLATYRADELDVTHTLHDLVPALVRQAGALPLHLMPLTTGDVRALLTARYPISEADTARLGRYIQRRAAGNPFYLGELLRTLEETQVIHAAVDGWAVADLTTAPVPLLVRHLIAARVARLEPAARDLLPVAATIGADVPLALWARTAGVAEEALLPVVAAAMQVGILTPDPDGTRIRFRHALIRDALYESALPPRRRAWHRAAAEAIIATRHPDPDAAAHHFQRAGDPRTAIWLYYAGARATAAAAYADGIARYMEAMALLPPSVWGNGPFATDADNSALAAHLRFDSGLAYALMGKLRAAFAEMEAALATLELRPAESGALSALLEDLNVPQDRRGMAATWLAYVGRFTTAEAMATRVLADPTTHSTRRGWKTRGDSLNALMLVRAAQGDAAGAWQAATAARTALESAGSPLLLSGFAEQALHAVALPYFADDLPRRDALAAAAEAARHRAGAMQGLCKVGESRFLR